MSILLLIIGAIAVMVGVGMVAFGIPINEFSFGNTLIVSGTTAATGGLIVIGLGVVVGQLHRIAEMLAERALARTTRPHETFEAPPEAPIAAPPPARVPFPPRPKPEFVASELPEPPEPRGAPPAGMREVPSDESVAPTLRNPDVPPMAIEDDVSLSPSSVNGPGAPVQGHEPVVEPPKRPPPPPMPPPPELPSSNFDAMWPPEPKPPRPTMGGEGPTMPRPERPPREPAASSEMPEPPAESPPRMTVAILKSGVVDGMAYTLYVDGSIEAELPQGTLRFASIEELRSHLDKNA